MSTPHNAATSFQCPYPVTGKAYLLTGGAGFIGSHLLRVLLEAGARVVVIDDFNDYYDPAIKEENIAPYQNHPNMTMVRGDIRNKPLLEEVFGRFGKDFRTGGIIHLAARAGVRPSLTQTPLYLETNVMATMYLAELAKDYEISRFVFASSSSVYGDAPESVPFREDQDISKPISPYASTKAMGESLLHTYSHLYGMQVVALRFFTVYGAAQRPDLAIHKFTRLIDAGKPIPVYGDGSTRRDYTYIDDILQGLTAALFYEGKKFDVFNLGESNTVTLAYLIELIENALGKKAIIDRQPLQPGDVTATFASIDKARQFLNYNPTTPIEQGIPRFVEWYRNRAKKLTVV